MGHHYVAQHYLRGFGTIAAPAVIWLFHKRKTFSKIAPIKTVAQHVNYYSPEVEEFLRDKIESPTIAVLNKIRELRPVSYQDKVTLSTYVVAQIARVPAGKELSRKYVNARRLIQLSEFERLWQEYKVNEPEKAKRLDSIIRQEYDFWQDEERVVRSTWEYGFAGHDLSKAVIELTQMTWHLYVGDRDISFITSDNPVVQHHGLIHPDSELIFPISRTIALIAGIVQMSDSYFLPSAEYVSADDHQVLEVNRKVIAAATEWIYSSIDAPWITEQLKAYREKKWPGSAT